jgi:hypothetical protein
VAYCSLLLHHFHKPNNLTKKEAKIEFYLKVDTFGCSFTGQAKRMLIQLNVAHDRLM